MKDFKILDGLIEWKKIIQKIMIKCFENKIILSINKIRF